jgi:hypothetical protein
VKEHCQNLLQDWIPRNRLSQGIHTRLITQDTNRDKIIWHETKLRLPKIYTIKPKINKLEKIFKQSNIFSFKFERNEYRRNKILIGVYENQTRHNNL